jgi:2-polyprenyl-6-methoxyphenol hydroxylase-like FAD-dependent oxidoreductase
VHHSHDRGGYPPVRQAIFHYGDERLSLPIRSGAGVDALYAPRRTVLDVLLARAAAAAGATFRFGCSVIELEQDSTGRVSGVVLRDRAGSTRTEHARIVIGADGRHSSVADLVAAGTRYTGRSASAFVYGYYRDLPVDGYEWFYRPGLAVGAIPTNDHLTCVFVAAPPARVAELVQHGGPDHAMRAVAGAFTLGDRIIPATQVDGLRYMRGLPGYLRSSTGPGWALVGDSGYWKDPLTTHGLSDAFRDAELLARAVVAAPDPGPAQGYALADYRAQRAALAHPLLDVTERIAAFEWDLTEIRQLLIQLSAVMNDEFHVLSPVQDVA